MDRLYNISKSNLVLYTSLIGSTYLTCKVLRNFFPVNKYNYINIGPFTLDLNYYMFTYVAGSAVFYIGLASKNLLSEIKN